MKPTRKQIVYGVVLAGSSALLIAQVLERRNRPRPPATIERGALDDVSADGTGDPGARAGELSAGVIVTIDGAPRARAPEAAVEAPAGDAESAPALDPEHDPRSVLDRLEESLASLHNIAPGARRPNLDRLSRGWAKERVEPAPASELPATLFTPAPPAPEPAASAAAADSAPSDAEAAAADDLLQFLSANPLAGIVAGASDSAAMFGGRIVRAGEQLVPGDAFVKAIERRAVLVTYKRRDVRIELPPFRPRPRPDEGQPSASGSASGAAGSAPATDASPAPAAGAAPAGDAGGASEADATASTDTEAKDATKKD